MDNNNGHHGQVLEFDSKPFTPTPPEQFDGAAILDRVSDFIKRYISLTEPQARLVTVWVAHTHAVSASTTTPYININSAVKQSGKTRLLEVFELLVNKPWLTGRVSAACLIRKVDQVRPTLLLDESDAAFSGEKEYAEALRGILNTGFYAGGVASCCVGQGASITFKDFKTFSAKAIAGIGSSLPDTVFDRSMPIRLQRKKPGEVVARFRRRYAKAEAAEIKTQLSDWITSIIPGLKDAEPTLPHELTDRQQDGIEPLLAIADEAGGDWPQSARQAAVEIFRSQAAQDQNIGVQLLADIRDIFDAKKIERIFSVDLAAALATVETSPWAEWKNQKPITVIQLARLLKIFAISPKTIRSADGRAKGYETDSFADAFARYLTREASRPDNRPVTPCQTNVYAGETHFSTRDTKCDVTTPKSEESPMFMRVVTDVTGQNSPQAGVDTKEGGGIKNLTSCPVCGSYAVDPRTNPPFCFTCESKSAS